MVFHLFRKMTKGEPFSFLRIHLFPSLSCLRPFFKLILGAPAASSVRAFAGRRCAYRSDTPGLRKIAGKESGTGDSSSMFNLSSDLARPVVVSSSMEGNPNICEAAKSEVRPEA